MKPICFVKDQGELGMQFTGNEYNDAQEARKDLANLPPGRYNLVRVLEANINVEPPALATKNVVKRGLVLTERRRSPKATAVAKPSKAKKATGDHAAQ